MSNLDARTSLPGTCLSWLMAVTRVVWDSLSYVLNSDKRSKSCVVYVGSSFCTNQQPNTARVSAAASVIVRAHNTCLIAKKSECQSPQYFSVHNSFCVLTDTCSLGQDVVSTVASASTINGLTTDCPCLAQTLYSCLTRWTHSGSSRA